MPDVIDRDRTGVHFANRLLLVLAIGLTVTACATSGGVTATGGAGSPSPVATPSPPPEPAPVESVEPTIASGGPSPSAPAAVAMTQPWATTELTDVRTGETFQIADLVAQGKVVFAEPMAIWCSNCKDQQRAARDAMAGVDPSKVVWLGIDVELSESAANLAKYADLNEFPFSYAVSNVELSRALAAEFGDGVLSPPNVNVIVVGTDGSVQHMTGHHEADELVAIATAAGG